MTTSKEANGSDVMINVAKAILANSMIANGVTNVLDSAVTPQAAERSVP